MAFVPYLGDASTYKIMITATASATKVRSPIHPDLGKELGVFHWDAKQRARSALWTNATLFVAGLGLVLFFSSLTSGVLIWLGVAIAAAIGVSDRIQKHSHHLPGRAISLYELGLIDERCTPAKIIRYQQVAEIYQSSLQVGAESLLTFKLIPKDGSPCYLNHKIENLQRLGAFLQRACLPYQLPQYIEDLQAQKDLNFGQITLNSQAVMIKQRSIPWQDFETYDLLRDRLSIVGEKFEDSVAMGDLSNWHVLVVLLRELKAQA